MPDYTFYIQEYGGGRLTEAAFPGLALRARGCLEQLRQQVRVTGEERQLLLAQCAMAECLQEHDRRCHHTAVTVGSVSYRNPEPAQSLEQQLYRAAGRYLTLYRGVC